MTDDRRDRRKMGGHRVRTWEGWSVFDAVRTFPSTPDALMVEIDAAIASAEYARSAAALLTPLSPPPHGEQIQLREKGAEVEGRDRPSPASAATVYDARLADEAYKAACAALAAGRPDAAVRSVQVALASCPPDKPSALAKLRSLLSISTSQLQKQRQKQQLQEVHAVSTSVQNSV